MSNVLAIVQARVNSSRLPRKSLACIGRYAAVRHVWERAHDAAEILTVIAVPASDYDAFLGLGIPRGSQMGLEGPEEDVLSRFYGAASHWARDIIVRLTADCPFVDPDGIREVVAAVKAGADYATLTGIPNGFDAEAFTARMLYRACRDATDPHDREHVTPWIARNAASPVTIDRGLPRWRLTLDTAEDLDHLRAIAVEIDCTPPHPTVEDLLALFERRPDLLRMDT